MFEKIYNSAIFGIFEKLYKLIVLNMLFVLTFILGLGIFGYMISLIILVLGIKSLIDDKEYSIVKTWIIKVKQHYVKALKLSLFFTVIGGLMTFNTIFFYLAIEENPIMTYQIAYYTFLIIDVFLILGTINAAFVFVYFPNLDIKKILKYSFKLLQIIPVQGLLLLTALGLTVLWIYVFPMVLIFIWFSTAIYVFALSINKKYSTLVADGVKSLSMIEY